MGVFGKNGHRKFFLPQFSSKQNLPTVGLESSNPSGCCITNTKSRFFHCFRSVLFRHALNLDLELLSGLISLSQLLVFIKLKFPIGLGNAAIIYASLGNSLQFHKPSPIDTTLTDQTKKMIYSFLNLPLHKAVNVDGHVRFQVSRKQSDFFL